MLDTEGIENVVAVLKPQAFAEVLVNDL